MKIPFTQEELIKAFEIGKIQISGAQVNLEKLDWMNKEHMKKLQSEEIKNKIFSYLPAEFQNEKLIPVIFERISKWSDIKTMLEAGELDCFSTSKTPEYNKEKLIYKNISLEKISSNLKLAIQALGNLSEENFTTENLIVKSNFIQFFDKRLFVLNKVIKFKKKHSKKLNLDYLVISNNTKMRIEDVQQMFRVKMFVFDSSNSEYKIKKWKEECEELNQEYCSTMDAGALEINLD